MLFTSCFWSQANHTPVESNKKPNNNSINKNKLTRECFLVLGRCLCVWDTAGLNSTVPSLWNWFRKLRSFTYSFISFSLFTSLCSGSLRHTRFNHMLSNAAAPHHDETHWNTSHGHVLWAVSVYWFPPPPPHFLFRPHIFLSLRYMTIPCVIFKGSRFARLAWSS